MACGSCGTKPRAKVKITSQYVAREKVNHVEMILSAKIEKIPNAVRGQNKTNNQGS